jgi:hypothetical protein
MVTQAIVQETKQGSIFAVRTQLLAVAFALAGGALLFIFPIEEIDTALYAVPAALLGYLSVLIGSIIFNRWLKFRSHKRIAITCIGLLMLSATMYYVYIDFYGKYTYQYADGFVPAKPVRHLTGCYYTEDAQAIIDSGKLKKPPVIITPPTLVRHFKSLITGKILVDRIWDDNSMNCARRIFFIVYVLFVIVFSFSIGTIIKAASDTIEIKTNTHSLITITVKRIHFEDLGGEDFERLVVAYLTASKKWRWKILEWVGQSGSDGGRDIWGEVAKGQTWCFQCANHAQLAAQKITDDFDKLKKHHTIPQNFVAVCGSKISAAFREKVKVHTKGLTNCQVWSGAEFEERVRSETPDIIRRFFEGQPF